MTGRRRTAQFLAAARDDIARLALDDPALARLALRKVRDLEAGLIEGIALHDMARTGDLTDCRKLYFGPGAPPSHRIVYRELPERVEVVEVVAAEARAERYAYLLAAVRLGRLPHASRDEYHRVHQAVVQRRAALRRTTRD